MKRILSKITSKVHRDNRGMSLVEILCAVAILALVSGVIGSVIVISTRTYSRGVSETNIQQEAQLAANNIGDIIKDACGVIYGASGAEYTKDGEVYERDENGNLTTKPNVPKPDDPTQPKQGESGVTELSILTNDEKQYTVKYYAETHSAESLRETLWYEVIDNAEPSNSVAKQLMAKGISQFEADTSGFKDSKSIKLKLTVKDGDREIPMEYTMTSRNGVGQGMAYTATSDSPTIAIAENEIVLVPGEEYKVEFSIFGDIKREDLAWGSSTGFEVPDSFEISPTDSSEGSVKIKIPVDDGVTRDESPIPLVIKAVNGAGVEKASATVNVRIRRVKGVKVNYSVNTDNTGGTGMMESAGAEFTFSANVSGNNMTKGIAYDYDNNYKTAQAVVWSFWLQADGRDIITKCDYIDGTWKRVYSEGDESEFGDYLEILTGKEVEDAAFPQITMKLVQDMPADFSLTVRATSKHALGVNKADSQYYDNSGADPKSGNNGAKDIYWGENEALKPRPTLVKSATKYVLLEPTETKEVDVNVLGAGMSQAGTVSIDFDHTYKRQDGLEYTADSRSDTTGTKAEYIYDPVSGKKTVKITAGRDEKGHKEYNSGIGTEVWDYNVYVNLKTNGGERCTIIVNISRVDVISLELEHPASSESGITESNADRRYRFNVRFNTDLEKKYKSLMRYLTSDEEKAKRNLATKFTITYTNTATGATLASDQVTINGAGEVISGSLPEKKGPNGDYSILVTSSIPKDGSIIWESDPNNPDSDYQFINPSSTPHVFVSLAKDTLPMNRKLTVKAEAMHPTGGEWTNDGVGSYTTVEAVEKYIEGPQKIEVDSDTVIVEPLQGPDDKGDHEMVIPIYVSNGSVYRMKAELSGNSDNTTRIAAAVRDSFGNDSNPYTLTSYKMGSQWVWYLSLQIGKEEKGNNGLFDVTIRAYDTDNTQLEEKTIHLAVRRVNEVDLKVSGSSDINKVNKANKKITLEAYPKGYGKDNIEYFERQTKDGSNEVCRWETAGHGAYKSPYPMKWMMEYRGTEKELKDWKEYFSSISYTKTDKEYQEKHRESVTFTLVKALPAGAKIRAYSLHSLGANNSTQYNKAGMAYVDGGVYGEISINDDIIVADGFKRGMSYDFIDHNDIVNIQQTLGWCTRLEQASFYRYREVGGTYGKYHMMDSKQGNYATAGYVPMSYLFRPDKEYEMEVVSVLYNKTDKLIYWPLDEELLEKGRGWTEAGFTFWQPTEEQGKKDWSWWSYSEYKEYYNKIQNIPEIKKTFLIPKSEMSFCKRALTEEQKSNTLTVDEKTTTVGSESKPIRLNGNNGSMSDYSGFIVDLAITGYEQNTDQQCFRTIVQKKIGSEWITLGYDDDSKIHDNEHFKVDSGNPYISIYRTGDAQGLYRVVPVILAYDKIKWRDVNDTPNGVYTDMKVLLEPEYKEIKGEDYHLYDYKTGKYVIYFEFYQ